MLRKLGFWVLVILLSVKFSWAQEIEKINDKIFINNEGTWYKQANDGRLWELVPGQLSFKFKAQVSEDEQRNFLNGKKVLRSNRLGVYDIELSQVEDVFAFFADL